jgi:transcriptional regulator with XRE-family HTH domain
MKDNLNCGVILRHLRKHCSLTLADCAEKIGRSKGWLSEIENGTGRCQISAEEFQRIVDALGAAALKPMFRTWAANNKKFERVDRSMEGAVLKYVRKKQKLRLVDVAAQVGLTAGQLSKVENGYLGPTVELRKKVLEVCGYNPASFKNLYADPERSKVVPYRYKLKILLRKLPEEKFEELFRFLESLVQAP